MTELVSNPVVKAELEPIDVAIRKERKRVWDLEDETGEEQSSNWLEYLCRAKARGVEHIVTELLRRDVMKVSKLRKFTNGEEKAKF